MRFMVSLRDGDTAGVVPQNEKAGFMDVNTPEINIEEVTYKEGGWIYQRKYPGNPTMAGDLTMNRGVTRSDSSFWDWAQRTAEGKGEYRADLNIEHYHRSDYLDGSATQVMAKTAQPAKTYTVFNAFPTSHKVATDLDANTGDVSIMSLNVAYEFFEIATTPAQ
jgi:phage tail-like protein